MNRRSPAERKAALEERKKQIEAQLQALNARERATSRKLDTRRKIVVGAAVLAHADQDRQFRALLAAILQTSVTRPIDRQVIERWLKEKG